MGAIERPLEVKLLTDSYAELSQDATGSREHPSLEVYKWGSGSHRAGSCRGLKHQVFYDSGVPIQPLRAIDKETETHRETGTSSKLHKALSYSKDQTQDSSLLVLDPPLL
jgi:hypothetical protein